MHRYEANGVKALVTVQSSQQGQQVSMLVACYTFLLMTCSRASLSGLLDDCVNKLDDCVNKLDDCVNKLDDCVNKLDDCVNKLDDCVNKRLLLVQGCAASDSRTDTQR